MRHVTQFRTSPSRSARHPSGCGCGRSFTHTRSDAVRAAVGAVGDAGGGGASAAPAMAAAAGGAGAPSASPPPVSTGGISGERVSSNATTSPLFALSGRRCSGSARRTGGDAGRWDHMPVAAPVER